MSTTETSGIGTTVDEAAAAASAAFPAVRRASSAERARWLVAIADAIDAHADELIAIATDETHIPAARLAGEVVRTTGQLRMFAAVITEGACFEAIIDHARPDLVPPAPDLRRLLVPLGPVAVFSASNFPFAFSVAGGDTASALAAGCPVVVKAHEGHPALSARTAEVVAAALADAGAPAGWFGIVAGRESGKALVLDPRVQAVGFTGSTRGGKALFDLAMSRADPIPFYGELGSVNPVVVTPGADAARADELAAGLAQSFQISLGQLCTKPGVVLVPAGGRFVTALAQAVEPVAGLPLNDLIGASFHDAADAVLRAPGVRVVAGGASGGGPEVGALVVATDVATARANPVLTEEHFGPMTVLVEYADLDEAVAFAESLGGALTVTLHAEDGEADAALVDRLVRLAGRVLFAGWPTGVAVNWSQHHGGPWPATTSVHTSVGATAIRRFLRPVAYQSAPPALLPAELQEENPLGIPRRVDGVLLPART